MPTKPAVIQALEGKELTVKFHLFCRPETLFSEAVTWLKKHTGQTFTYAQVKMARIILDCEGKRGGKRPGPKRKRIVYGRAWNA